MSEKTGYDVMITGATGFTGSHLLDLLGETEPAWTLHGTRRQRSDMSNVAHLEHVNWHNTDLTDFESVDEVVKAVKPDIIFHLGARSFVPESWSSPVAVWNANTVSTINVLEAVRRHVPESAVHLACSSEEYGLVSSNKALIEKSPFHPRSIYAVSKIATEYLGIHYHVSYGIPVYITRAFNHTGPRRHPNFVCSTFAFQLARMAAGLQQHVLEVGNLEAERDFTDVRDMVRAYKLCVERAKPGIPYVVASGETYSIQYILDMLREISGISPKIVRDEARCRPSDVPRLLGNPAKFIAATGWERRYSFWKTLESLYKWAQEEVKNGRMTRNNG